MPFCLIDKHLKYRRLLACQFPEDLLQAFFLEGKGQDSKSLTDSKIKNVTTNITFFVGFQ